MGYPISVVGTMTESQRRRLREAGIRSTEDLLIACCDGCGRGAIAGATGIAVRLLHEWANVADLMRICGVGHTYAELLTAAGVRGVAELRAQDPSLLTARLASVHAAATAGGKTAPSAAMVADWIQQAKTLPPTVSH